MLAQGDRQLAGVPSAVGIASLASFQPWLYNRSASGSVLLEAVAVDVAVVVDPLERPLDVGTDRGEFVGVAVPAPGERGDEHESVVASCVP